MTLRASFLLLGGLVCALASTAPVRASDHADTAANFNRPGADMADVYIFPSPVNNNNVVLVMDVHPLIPAGQSGSVSFDPNVLYQFKIDTTGDYIEDLVIQARFSGSGASQRVLISGPYKPLTIGTSSIFARPYSTAGFINSTFSPTSGMTVFAGPRSDPFFFDLAQFFTVLPDRQTPGTGMQVNYPSIMKADTPGMNPDGSSNATGGMGFRGFPAGSGYNTSPASDLLSSFNVLSIVVELPRSMLGGGKIGLWETTSVLGGAPGFQFNQQDRLARPAVNEALATVSQTRHQINNLATPVAVNGSMGDAATIKTDILAFMNFPAGRSAAISNVLAAVLVPDVMIADLSNMTDKASYLGVETGGATGGKFGGRALTDDVIDIDLGAIFGNIIPSLGLAPDDGKELPSFATDNIGPHKDYLSIFPYLGVPH